MKFQKALLASAIILSLGVSGQGWADTQDNNDASAIADDMSSADNNTTAADQSAAMNDDNFQDNSTNTDVAVDVADSFQDNSDNTNNTDNSTDTDTRLDVEVKDSFQDNSDNRTDASTDTDLDVAVKDSFQDNDDNSTRTDNSTNTDVDIAVKDSFQDNDDNSTHTDNSVDIGHISFEVAANTSVLGATVSGNNLNINSAAGSTLSYRANNRIGGGASTTGVAILNQNTGAMASNQNAINVMSNLTID